MNAYEKYRCFAHFFPLLLTLSDWLRISPSIAPSNCAAINGAIDLGAIPAKVSDQPLAKVTAGLAKDVEEVKK